MKKILNTLIRVGTLGSKFVVLFLLSFYLDPSDVGRYGIITGTVAFLVLILGIDFYTQANRDAVSVRNNGIGSILEAQAKVYLISYGVMILIGLVLTVVGFAQVSIITTVIVLAIPEHLSQEYYRIFVALNRQTIGTVTLFVRSGVWGVAVACCFFFIPQSRSLEFVIVAWLIGSTLSVVLASVYSAKAGFFRRDGMRKSSSWIWKRLQMGLVFFLGTSALSALTAVDRLVLNHLEDLSIVGVYTLYISVSGGLRSVLDAGTLAYSLPKILKAGQESDVKSLRREVSLTVRQVVIVVSLVAATFAICMFFFVREFLPNIYKDNFTILIILLVAFSSFCISMPAHQALYALRADFQISASNLLTFFVFGLVLIWLARFGAFGVACAMLLGMVIGAVARFCLLKKVMSVRLGREN
ncbi:lipopolysaccharide biosynthesis protein [Pseudoclavibacter sp. CFCC 11306]|uniref:lipopolysaccharide biosynthesis protein n=1 Tax=Pseudoclavibacter sp. CFCC 11306 TaxID=1564493 RepID=UPI0017886998|nr:oligosaccharide flippase family protein [Pseudoclavibacter sp. CFCC 11306]